MQFQVPQFIEVEDKIIGPLTIKQFIYLAGGGGIAIALYFLIPIKFIAIILAVPFVALSAALAFYKINGKNFVDIMEAAISFWLKNKLYIWKKVPKNLVEKKKEEEISLEPLMSPRLSDSKLKELAWSLDVNEQVDKQKFRQFASSNKKEEKENVEFKKNYEIGSRSHT